MRWHPNLRFFFFFKIAQNWHTILQATIFKDAVAKKFFLKLDQHLEVKKIERSLITYKAGDSESNTRGKLDDDNDDDELE